MSDYEAEHGPRELADKLRAAERHIEKQRSALKAGERILAAAKAVLHQLEHGEASDAAEGDGPAARDIRWCARELREAIEATDAPDQCAKCGRPLDSEGECRGGCSQPSVDPAADAEAREFNSPRPVEGPIKVRTIKRRRKP